MLMCATRIDFAEPVWKRQGVAQLTFLPIIAKRPIRHAHRRFVCQGKRWPRHIPNRPASMALLSSKSFDG
jgi:hypothetical protein